MRRNIASLLVAALLLFSAALAECPSFDLDTYPVVDGSTATLPLSYALMETSVGVDEDTAKALITHSKTTESFYALCFGDSDLLLVYEPSEDAYDLQEEYGVTYEMKPIGLDALVFLVNEANPVTSLTHEQILSIYTGEVTNWSQVGGEDREIIAYQRIANSGSQVMMEAQVMQGTPMAEAPKSLAPSEMGELIEEVASYSDTANAIGYSVYYYVHNMHLKEGIRTLDVNGVTPTNETIASYEYPYRQPFYAVIRASEPADSPARQLYDWLTTDEGCDLIEGAGYVAMPGEAAE